MDATVAWLLGQPGSFFRPYAGKWIAARDCQIIAVADNDRELMAQIDRADWRRTLIHRVERPGLARPGRPTEAGHVVDPHQRASPALASHLDPERRVTV